MKLWNKNLKQKDIDYYSYGIDYKEDESEYWYLQTASNTYEEYEIISSKYEVIPLIIGKIISLITRKRLVKW